MFVQQVARLRLVVSLSTVWVGRVGVCDLPLLDSTYYQVSSAVVLKKITMASFRSLPCCFLLGVVCGYPVAV